MLLALSAMQCVQRLRRTQGETFMTSMLRFAAGASLLTAIYVAFSRVHDYWHFPADVITGASLGFATAASVCWLMSPPAWPTFATEKETYEEGLKLLQSNDRAEPECDLHQNPYRELA